MPTITAKSPADGAKSYRAAIRIKGKVVYRESRTFDRKALAKGWATRREFPESDGRIWTPAPRVLLFPIRSILAGKLGTTTCVSDIVQSGVILVRVKTAGLAQDQVTEACGKMPDRPVD